MAPAPHLEVELSRHPASAFALQRLEPAPFGSTAITAPRSPLINWKINIQGTAVTREQSIIMLGREQAAAIMTPMSLSPHNPLVRVAIGSGTFKKGDPESCAGKLQEPIMLAFMRGLARPCVLPLRSGDFLTVVKALPHHPWQPLAEFSASSHCFRGWSRTVSSM